jgi:hypothetical protein
MLENVSGRDRVSNILYWLADRTACGHYRCLLPGAALEAKGHTVTADEVLKIERYDECDVLVGQRVAKPGPSAAWQAFAREEGRSARLVYELDDDVFALANEPSNPNSAVWPKLLGNVRANLACADAVTVSTYALAEVVAAHTSAPVHVVPNAIPESLIASALTPRIRPDTLGWSGSATHEGDWAADDNARRVAQWLDSNSNRWRLVTFGGAPKSLTSAFDGYRNAFWDPQGGAPLEKYYALLRTTFDIGLAPLARTTFNVAKSDLRLLELAALGIPWVATDFGPYADGADGLGCEDRGGLTVSKPRGWWTHLNGLAGSDEYRLDLRARGRAWARTRTIDRVLPLWEEAFELTSGTVPDQA